MLENGQYKEYIKLNISLFAKGSDCIIEIRNTFGFPPMCPLKRNVGLIMDHLHYRLNFDLNKSRQIHHSLKEHHKISNIPKFHCEML
jgi:hypothetical protein